MRLALAATAALSVAAVSLAIVPGASAQEAPLPPDAASAPAAQAAPPAVPSSEPPAPASPAIANAPPAAPADPHEDVLRRLLRSGCRDGFREARDLAASGGAPWAATVARLCGEVLRAHAGPAPRPPRVERDGRGTLVVYSTVYGIWAGVAFDALVSVNNARVGIIAPLLGMGGGLALSLGVSDGHPVTNGQAWAIATGYDYGTINGALWAGAFGYGAKGVVGTALATGVVATAAGITVAVELAPRQGDVEVVRSGLLWGTLIGLTGMGTFAPNAESKTYFRGMAAAMDLGFLAGVAIAASSNVSRTRDLIIDAGTLGGGVTGLGVAVLAAGSHSTGQVVAAGSLAGMAAGMLTTILLTRGMDPEEDTGAAVAALVGRDARGRWHLGSPGATPVLDGLGRRIVGATFTALGGTF